VVLPFVLILLLPPELPTACFLTRSLVALYAIAPHPGARRTTMLWTLAVILLVLWALGLVTSYTMHGFVHILLVVALVVVVLRVIQGRRAID
jgi:hypothetical protein